MLNVKSVITDCVLEPDDQTVLKVTVHNTHRTATACKVGAKLKLKCGPQRGVSLGPAQMSFGDVGPCKSVCKDFVITTKGAQPSRKHDVTVLLEYLMKSQESECISFGVGKD